MFIDFVPLMLLNMVGGLAVLAHFIMRGLPADDQRAWAPGFAMSGLVALICGLYMVFTWPLPGSYNVAFGECSVLYGIIYLGGALAMSRGWKLDLVAVYAFFGGAIAVLVGIRIIGLGMTKAPPLSGAGFILTGAGGIFAYPALRLRRHAWLRAAGALAMAGAAGIWALIGALGYWDHLASLSTWAPLILQKAS